MGGGQCGGVVEEGDVGGTEGFVDDEVVEFVVLEKEAGGSAFPVHYGGLVEAVEESTYVRDDDLSSN